MTDHEPLTGTHDRLVGSWRLLSWEAVAEGQAPHRPMGTDVEGLLVYSSDGTMMVLIGSAGRAAFAAADLLQATPEERSRAIETFIAYGGSYDVSADTVRHHVAMSLFPNWVGSVQQRYVAFDEGGDVLTLTSDPILVRGSERSQRLVWERVRR